MCNNLCIIYKNYIVYHQKYWALTNAYNGTIIILVFTSEIILKQIMRQFRCSLRSNLRTYIARRIITRAFINEYLPIKFSGRSSWSSLVWRLTFTHFFALRPAFQAIRGNFIAAKRRDKLVNKTETPAGTRIAKKEERKPLHQVTRIALKKKNQVK